MYAVITHLIHFMKDFYLFSPPCFFCALMLHMTSQDFLFICGSFCVRLHLLMPLVGMSVFRYVAITTIHGNMMHNGNILLLNNGFKLEQKINAEHRKSQKTLVPRFLQGLLSTLNLSFFRQNNSRKSYTNASGIFSLMDSSKTLLIASV